MIARVLTGIVSIATAILLSDALFRSDRYLGIQRFYLNIVFWLPLAALLVSLLVFLILVLIKQLKSIKESNYFSWYYHSLGFSWSCRCGTVRYHFHPH